MTHRRLLEKWKEKREKEMYARSWSGGFAWEEEDELRFLTRAMLAAAKGAAEAGRLNEVTARDTYRAYIPDGNAASSRSEQQLKEHFKE